LRFFQRGGLILADVDSKHQPFGARAAQPPCQELGAAVGKSHPVDHGFLFHQAEDARFRVAGLRARGHRAHLDVPEPQAGQPAPAQTVFIVAGGHAERVGEIQTESLHGRAFHARLEPGAQQPAADTHPAAQAQQRDGGFVRLFRRQAKDQRTNDTVSCRHRASP
jgi:hypothetical protein